MSPLRPQSWARGQGAGGEGRPPPLCPISNFKGPHTRPVRARNGPPDLGSLAGGRVSATKSRMQGSAPPPGLGGEGRLPIHTHPTTPLFPWPLSLWACCASATVAPCHGRSPRLLISRKASGQTAGEGGFPGRKEGGSTWREGGGEEREGRGEGRTERAADCGGWNFPGRNLEELPPACLLVPC